MHRPAASLALVPLFIFSGVLRWASNHTSSVGLCLPRQSCPAGSCPGTELDGHHGLKRKKPLVAWKCDCRHGLALRGPVLLVCPSSHVQPDYTTRGLGHQQLHSLPTCRLVREQRLMLSSLTRYMPSPPRRFRAQLLGGVRPSRVMGWKQHDV